MLVEAIHVKNFRSIRDATLHCDELIAMVGRNGVGKSSFLQAVDLFFDLAPSVSEEDFFDRDTAQPIEVEITFRHLLEEERHEFQSYVHDDVLIVIRRIASENGRFVPRYYVSEMQIRQFATIRALAGKPNRSRLTRNWWERRSFPACLPR